MTSTWSSSTTDRPGDRRRRRRALVPDLGRRPPARPLRALGLRGRRRSPSTDVKAGLGLLDARLVAGDAELAARLRTATLASWRQAASRLLPQLRDLRRDRARQLGELAFLLEPDLKEAYGGLREGQVLRASPPPSSATSRRPSSRRRYAFLLDVRDELRRRTGRPTDVLVRQEQRPVADALGLADEDALLREVSLAGRRLAFVADETWRRVEAAAGRAVRAAGTGRVRREPLAEGVVRQGDEVVLARDAQPGRRPRACCCAPRPPRRGRPAALAVHAEGAGGAQPAAARAVAGRGALVLPAAAGQRARRRAGAGAAGPGGPARPG